MWWNPLTYVRSERHALEMADVFASASRPVGAKPDGFFDPAGEISSRLLLMGAALHASHSLRCSCGCRHRPTPRP